MGVTVLGINVCCVVSMAISTMYWPVGFRGYELGVRLVIEVVAQLTRNTGSNNNNDLAMVRIMGARLACASASVKAGIFALVLAVASNVFADAAKLRE